MAVRNYSEIGQDDNQGVPLGRLLVYGILLIAVVGSRGHMLAHTIGGRYLWKNWLSDAAAFAILIAGLKLADSLVQWVGRRLAANRIGAFLFGLVRVSLLFGVFFPFLLATLQIHPQRISTKGNPTDWDLPYEDVVISSRGRNLHGWYCPNPKARSAVFVAHGLNANRENFLRPVQLLHDLGHAVLIIDFPAHGDSGGRSTTLGMLEAADVKAAHDWLAAKHAKQPIHALGYSMGASAVLTAADNFEIFDRIAVDATFSSIRQVADAVVLRFAGPAKNLIWNAGAFWIAQWTGADLGQHRPIDHIAKLKPEKLLIIHGTADKVIPFAEGERLHQATSGRATFIRVENYGHAETINHPDYASWLDEFFEP